MRQLFVKHIFSTKHEETIFFNEIFSNTLNQSRSHDFWRVGTNRKSKLHLNLAVFRQTFHLLGLSALNLINWF